MSSTDDARWRPVIVDAADADDRRWVGELIADGEVTFVHDTLDEQLGELVTTRAKRRLDPEQTEAHVAAHLDGRDRSEYGRWVFFPWSRRLVHLLDEPEFTEVRFNRNHYKITPEQQGELRRRTIAVAGLSVGQSAAITLVMEGVGGRFVIADFDTLGLSNLNRLRAGVHQLGVNKAVLAAREMFEIDPYIDVSIFPAGLNDDNVDAFFDDGPPLDLLVEECDDLYMKVRLREHARARRVPVIMDTSDRGLIDVERFDREPDRPLFHDIIGSLDAKQLVGLPTKEKVPFVLNLLDDAEMSVPFAASLLEVEQSIYTWPQLASGVTLGGALVTDAARRLLLGSFEGSGRFYVDIEQLVGDGAQAPTRHVASLEPEVCEQARQPRVAPSRPATSTAGHPSEEEIRFMVTLATMAPSGGNGQPWSFAYDGDRLSVAIAPERTGALLDFRGYASRFAIGAAVENLEIAARSIGWGCEVESTGGDDVCRVSFERRDDGSADSEQTRAQLAQVTHRVTNRRLAQRQPLASSSVEAMKRIASDGGGELLVFAEPQRLRDFGKILGDGDRIRYLSPQMHGDLMSELRWDPQSVATTRTGIDLPSLELPAADAAGLRVLASWPVMEFVGNLGGGQALASHAHKAMELTSAVARLSIAGSGPQAYFQGGRVMQRLWLEANARGVALQPYSAFLFLFARLQHDPESLESPTRAALETLREHYRQLVVTPEGHTELFFFRLAHAAEPTTRSLRLPVDEVLKIFV